MSALAAFELHRVCVLQWEPRAFSGDAVAWEKDERQPEREQHQLEKEYSCEQAVWSNGGVAVYLQKWCR